MGRGRSREHGTLRLCYITKYAHQVRKGERREREREIKKFDDFSE